jgi:hypothetical protein
MSCFHNVQIDLKSYKVDITASSVISNSTQDHVIFLMYTVEIRVTTTWDNLLRWLICIHDKRGKERELFPPDNV